MPLLLIPYPAFDPVLVHIGPLSIRWYALAYIFGILIGWVYARALIRSELWNPQKHLPRAALPSTGQMLEAVTHHRIDAQTYDRDLPPRLKATIY